LWCGESVYVGLPGTEARHGLDHAERGPLHQKSTVHENLYDAGGASTLTLVGDSSSDGRTWVGPGQQHDPRVRGVWDPAYDAATDPGIVTVSHADTPRHTARLAAHIAAGSRRAQRHSRR